MTKEEFKIVERGDILVDKHDLSSWIVDDKCGDSFIAVRTMRISNPDEWELFCRTCHRVNIQGHIV